MLRVLLAAFALVAVVLIWQQYHGLKRLITDRAPMRASISALASSLDRTEESVAVKVVEIADRQINSARRAAESPFPSTVFFQLQDQSGRVVYASAGIADLPAFSPQQANMALIRVRGVDYWPTLKSSDRWRVVVLEHAFTDAALLRRLGADLVPLVVLAAALLVPPLWWVVHAGLSPLRQFVATLGTRRGDDLTALNLDLRYSELQPIVAAIDGLLAQVRAHVDHERALVQNAAHELRTPLAVIAAHAHLLVNSSDPVAIASAQEGISRGIQRAGRLVQQLLVLARLESPTGRHSAQRVDLVAVCQRQIADLTPLADSKQIEVSLVSPDQLWLTVAVDVLQSVLDNLLRNALTHCPNGTRVELSISQANDTARIEVVDDGPGMTKEDRNNAFERFFRGQGAGTGSGLGLTIVKQAARWLRGDVELFPGPGDRGLRVVVVLPIHADEVQALGAVVGNSFLNMRT